MQECCHPSQASLASMKTVVITLVASSFKLHGQQTVYSLFLHSQHSCCCFTKSQPVPAHNTDCQLQKASKCEQYPMQHDIVQTTSLRLQLGCASCVTPTVHPPRPPRAAPKGCQVKVLEYGSTRGPNQAEAVRPQGYRVGSVLTSRDPAHPENAPNGCLHHRLYAC